MMIMVLTYSCAASIYTDDEVLQLHNKVDLVITLGGDGTVLWVNFYFNYFFWRNQLNKAVSYMHSRKFSHSLSVECPCHSPVG